MHRIAYRIVLPVVQLALYLLLIWYGCYYRPTWQHQLQHWITPRPVVADGWDPTWMDGSPSFAEQLALGINALAVFTSMLMLIPFDSLFPDGASRELAAHTAALFIPLLWYFTGRRLEQPTGATARPSTVGKVSMLTVLAVAALVALLISSVAGSPIRRTPRWPKVNFAGSPSK
jgi:hypothetical protein